MGETGSGNETLGGTADGSGTDEGNEPGRVPGRVPWVVGVPTGTKGATLPSTTLRPANGWSEGVSGSLSVLAYEHLTDDIWVGSRRFVRYNI